MFSYHSWKGAWAAIPTPFAADGSLDFLALKTHVRFLCDRGIDGLVVCGTTGEAATLHSDEKTQALLAVLEEVDDKVPVIAGVGSNDTQVTVDNAKRAQAAGAHGLLVVTPYYNKPNQEGHYRHFMTIADAVALPQLIYNVPGRTATKTLPETIGRLSKHANIVGIKDATADMLLASQTRLEAGDDFLLFSGDDATTLPFIALGGVGAISVVANLAPRLMHDIIDNAMNGDYEKARALHEAMLPLFNALFSDSSPIPLKALLHRSRLTYPLALRAPLYAMEEAQIDALIAPIQEMIDAL